MLFLKKSITFKKDDKFLQRDYFNTENSEKTEFHKEEFITIF